MGAMPPMRFGLRLQLAALFTLALTGVFVALFTSVSGFMTDRATQRLRRELNDALIGTTSGIDGDELRALYREGVPRGDGFSDDPRYGRQMAFFKQVHAIEPHAFPYTFVRGDAPDTRRAGRAARSPEFVYVVDIDSGSGKHAGFLEPDTGSPQALEAFETGKVVERPGVYTDRFGSWMSSYGPIRDHAGQIVGVLGVDYESSYVESVQQDVQRSLFKVFVITYCLVIVLVYFAAGFFTRPIGELTRATQSLREGTLGMSLPIERRPDELGVLARAWSDMSRRLGEAFHALERANSELENRVEERTKDLAIEQAKSEQLLRNVLPVEIAERLKHAPQSIAEGFDAVTVAFADIVGFTDLSARSTPAEIVKLLNEIFSAFDGLVDKYGLEKIKTIGDAYMVVGGLPAPRDDHARAIATMTLDMQAFMRGLRATYPDLAIRIGIHTGPVVAGVIGTKKFSYDLWGDTVNVASRMELDGERDRIHVSAAAAEALAADFDLEERGAIKVKGRGELGTFWLLGTRGAREPD
jgi:class 3 adenylate cyclase/HAMP domain-containing protein